MLGVIVNTLTVLVGSSIGLLAKKIIPRDWSGFIICGMGLCTMYIGISGSFEGQNTLVAVVSMAVGAVIGLSIGIDKRVNSGVSKLEKRFIKKPAQEGGTSFTEGFVTASMIFCVGAMTILGSLQAGLTGAIVSLAQFVEPFLSDAVIAEMTCVGSLILIGLALNLIGVAKIKVMDFTPAIFMPIAVVPMFDWIGGLF